MQDVIIIGGGIVGVSTALQLKQRHPAATSAMPIGELICDRLDKKMKP